MQFLTPDHPIDETPTAGTSAEALEALETRLLGVGYLDARDRDAILSMAQKFPRFCEWAQVAGIKYLLDWLSTLHPDSPLWTPRPAGSYTPGKWTHDADTVFVRVYQGYEIEVCNFKNSVYREEQAANVALVAAAPQLLEALENLVAQVNQNPAHLTDALALAGVAIATAKGL